MAARVADLVACIVDDEPGLTCPLAAGLVSAFGPAERYVGVLRSPSRDSQDPDPAVKGNLARFLWNHMASVTARVREALAFLRDANTPLAAADTPQVMTGSSGCRPTLAICYWVSLAVIIC